MVLCPIFQVVSISPYYPPFCLAQRSNLYPHSHLSCSLEHAELLSQSIFADCTWCINLISEHQEGDVWELFDSEQSLSCDCYIRCSGLLRSSQRHITKTYVQLRLCFREASMVCRVDQKDNTVYFGKVITPQSTSLLVTTQIVRSEFDIADGEFLSSLERQVSVYMHTHTHTHAKIRMLLITQKIWTFQNVVLTRM